MSKGKIIAIVLGAAAIIAAGVIFYNYYSDSKSAADIPAVRSNVVGDTTSVNEVSQDARLLADSASRLSMRVQTPYPQEVTPEIEMRLRSGAEDLTYVYISDTSFCLASASQHVTVDANLGVTRVSEADVMEGGCL